ncbi:hypothetical protein HYW54_05430 [Candidatus Gottesmanbacteria bacterium]|nr:hypothetical protein [Candidatus Gottesmanbacteria bacterium]
MKKSDLDQIKKVIEEVALTKKDAKNFLTKEDAKYFLTKEDAKNFATKDDLKNFATKQDLVGLARGSEIDNLKIEFLENLEKWKSEILKTVSDLAGRTKTAEEENAILKAREEGKDEIKRDHEERLKKLEILHPGNRHVPA